MTEIELKMGKDDVDNKKSCIKYFIFSFFMFTSFIEENAIK